MDEEEQENPRIIEINKAPARYDKDEAIIEDQDMEEPQEPIETPHETISTRKRPTWAHDIIQEEKRYGALEGRKRLRLHSNYIALISNLVDEEPRCFKEASKKN